jgi:hypothetical protein
MYLHVFSAKGAAFKLKPGATRQGFLRVQRAALKARFNFGRLQNGVKRALSGAFRGESFSWGDAPG